VSDETKSCSATACFCGKERHCCCCYSLLALGALLIAGALVWAVIHYTQSAPLTEERAVLRRKNLAELRAANAEALNHYGWVDQTRGIVRLPIDQAMKLTVLEWQNPAAGRSNLIARVEKATAPLPKAPEKPSQFE
jgi:hypothetical protein